MESNSLDALSVAAVIAVRVAEKDGWFLETGVGSPDDIAVTVDPCRGTVVEVREVYRCGLDGLGQLGPISGSWVRQHGWIFDEVADCWRTPCEPLCSPEGDPLAVKRFDLFGEPPDNGWWTPHLRTAGQSLEFTTLELFDPTQAILDWCERLAAGETSGLVFPEEAFEWDFVAYPFDDLRVRLTVSVLSNEFYSGGDWRYERELDIVLPRRDLVAAFYIALQALTRDREVFRTEWYEADCYGSAKQLAELNGDIAPQAKFALSGLDELPAYRSEVIEAYLSDGP